MSNIVVSQPLHHPASHVAYGTTPTSCYGDPRYLGVYNGTAYDGLTILGVDDVHSCGRMVHYTACSGSGTLVVVYETNATPHPVIKHGASCYAENGTITGFLDVVPATAVVPVPGCQDVACTPADPDGPSFVYFSSEGQEVGVLFEHLNTGTAHYGVAPKRVDSGLNGLTEGSVQFPLTHPRHTLLSVPGTGVLLFTIEQAIFFKSVILERGGQEIRYGLGAFDERLALAVQTGDVVYLAAASRTGRLLSHAVGVRVRVRWQPYVATPRLYDTGTLHQSGTLRALGFCGLVPHQKYTFFGTLPTDTTVTGLLNPDTAVTVQGADTGEMLVVRLRSQGDAAPPTPELPWYAGSAMQSPMIFRFYAGREMQGAHGEMDVWLDTNGTFPAAFSLDSYRAVERTESSYRKIQEPGDLPRGCLEVVPAASAFFLPRQYRGPDGRLLTLHSTAPTVERPEGTYTLVAPDPGLSFSIL